MNVNKVFAFHGVDFKVGTTMIAQSTAEILSKHDKDKKILLLFLNGRRSTNYCKENVESIESIKVRIDNKVLTKEDFLETCFRNGNLYMLAGIRRLFVQRMYQPEMVLYLINLVKDEFDLIIIDTGNEIDNGLAVGGLQAANKSFLVMTQQESIISRYESIENIYDKLKIGFSNFIINKFEQSDPYDLYYIARRLERDEDLFIKVKTAGFSRQAEMDYKTLLEYRELGYKDGIADIANVILVYLGEKPITSLVPNIFNKKKERCVL